MTVGCSRTLSRQVARVLEDSSSVSLSAGECFRVWSLKSDIVITRVVPVRHDYSGRPARLAHHIVVPAVPTQREIAAELLRADGIWLDTWVGPPAWLPVVTLSRVVKDAGAVRSDQRGSRSSVFTHDAWAARGAWAATVDGRSPFMLQLPPGISLQVGLAEIIRRTAPGSNVFVATRPDQLEGRAPRLLLLAAAITAPAGFEPVPEHARAVYSAQRSNLVVPRIQESAVGPPPLPTRESASPEPREDRLVSDGALSQLAPLPPVVQAKPEPVVERVSAAPPRMAPPMERERGSGILITLAIGAVAVIILVWAFLYWRQQ